MLHTVFPVVLNMSITASIAIIVVLFARLLLKRAPKIFSYALWAVVLFRLLCPISLTSALSLMNFLWVPSTDSGRIEYVSLNTDSTEVPTFTITVPAPGSNQPATPSLNGESPAAIALDVSSSALSIIWICGVAIMLVFHIVQLILFRRKLIVATPLRENIYLADYVPTPFVMGIIRPKIYLPSVLSDTEQSYIIQHEKHHIHRGDHVIKLLAFAVMCIHWFNPLVWLAFALSSKDMEMSCDEAVMKQMDRDIRADYSNSLLQFSTGKRAILGTPLAFGEGDTKERIKNIMKYKKPPFFIVVLALVVCLGLTACLSSNPLSDIEQANPNDSIANDDDDTPPVPDHDASPDNNTLPVPDHNAYPLQGGFADESMLSSGNYHEFIADNSEYMVKLLFQANEVLTDVHFTSLEYSENGTLRVAEELHTLSELTPDKPLVTGVVFYGSMTTYGISFVDAAGQAHHCAIRTSGQDGSLMMDEYSNPSVP